MSHYMPQAQLKHAPYTSAAASTQYEGTKAQAKADLALVESCLGKCNVNFAAAAGGLN